MNSSEKTRIIKKFLVGSNLILTRDGYNFRLIILPKYNKLSTSSHRLREIVSTEVQNYDIYEKIIDFQLKCYDRISKMVMRNLLFKKNENYRSLMFLRFSSYLSSYHFQD